MATIKEVQIHLRVLKERCADLNRKMVMRNRRGDYNRTEMNRLLSKVKSAKKAIADASFI